MMQPYTKDASEKWERAWHRNSSMVVIATTLNAKERRKLKRETERKLELEQENVLNEAEETLSAEKETQPEKLNAKERRKLKRQQAAEAAAGNATDTEGTVDESKLSAKERRKLKRSRLQEEYKEPAPKKKPKKQMSTRKIHRTLFVGQLPYTATKDDIKRHFEQVGEMDVRMRTDRKTKKFLGQCFLEVKDEKSLGAALARHHTLLHGRRINVEMTVSGGGMKSDLRKERIGSLRSKQHSKQAEKAAGIVQKYADDNTKNFQAEDIDDRLVDFLSWFDIETAKKALDDFSENVTATVRNRKAYMMSILKKYRLSNDGDKKNCFTE